MKVSTKLIGYDAGDFTLEESIADLERDGRVVVATTSQVSPITGLPLVRLVGEPEALLATLQDGWQITYDQAVALLEG